MNEAYKRENHRSYLVLQYTHAQMVADYGIKMLCDNPIDGILPMSVHGFNGEQELYYDISSKQSLNIFYEKREMGKEDLQKLFGGMKRVLEKLDEYLLDMEHLVLDPQYIYLQSNREVSFLYTADRDKSFESKTYDFADYLLGKVCNEDEQAVIYAYGFYRYVKEERGDLAAALEKLLEETGFEGTPEGELNLQEAENFEYPDFYCEDNECRKEENTADEKGQQDKRCRRVAFNSFFSVLGLGGIGIMAYSAWKNGLTFNTLFSSQESIVGVGICIVAIVGWILFAWMERRSWEEESSMQEPEAKEAVWPEPELYTGSAPVSEEFLEGTDMPAQEPEDYQTVLLQENCYREERILVGRIRGHKKQIDLSSFPFVIGKSKEQADYVLADSSVSRMHARFTLRDDLVYLTDLNSTNGTTHNGIRLEPNEMVLLEAEDEICFGRTSFIYH